MEAFSRGDKTVPTLAPAKFLPHKEVSVLVGDLLASHLPEPHLSCVFFLPLIQSQNTVIPLLSIFSFQTLGFLANKLIISCFQEEFNSKVQLCFSFYFSF